MSRTKPLDLNDPIALAAIRQALDAEVPDLQPVDLPKPQPLELCMRWSLQPAPVHSSKHLAALAAQRAYEAEQADKAIRNGRVR